ncbi:MAG TPA: hypothetical protein VKY53_05530 [Marinobacter sp.]|nr:hypothetical protein [Marinobacter sp.]
MVGKRVKTLIAALLLYYPGLLVASGLSLTPPALSWIGEQVFRNECASRRVCLVHWNEGEAFPSLGIGHFIWYPEGTGGRFTESFPALLAYLSAEGVPLPAWLAEAEGAPWPDRESFLQQAAHSDQVEELRQLLYETRGLQVLFILQRARHSRELVVAAAPAGEQAVLGRRLDQLVQTPGGAYALLDYVNFKGEGLAPGERYDGEGWGLLQVLQAMDQSPGDTVLEQFRDAAGRVLTRRAELAPASIERERWLPGWLKRVETYREPAPQALKE